MAVSITAILPTPAAPRRIRHVRIETINTISGSEFSCPDFG